MLRFAIVGGASPERNDPHHAYPYEPKVDVAKAREAARLLGETLAKRGHGLIVYDARFIEADVVSAYVAANPKMPERGAPIIVRQAPMPDNVAFPEEQTHPALFDRIPDSANRWEVTFYRRLADADGLILLGGANATSVAGQVAIGARVPVLALFRTGGGAETVWRTVVPGVDLPNGNEHARMADDPSEAAATGWADLLESQRRRRYAVEAGPIIRHAGVAGVLFILALAGAFGSHLWPGLDKAVAMALLLASTLLAGVSGAAVRMVFERRYGSGPLVPPSMMITSALGLMAGALAAMLYIVAQPGTLDVAGDAGLRFVSFILVVATVGGLTAEAVFRKLLGIDVARTGGLPAGGSVGKP
ncbi:MAG TPA: hypothetical protein VF169_13650 [Albitalea sp.]|uniref:hypothetical protein n=1 Tax=Piscinibacter sp. TaxID=1903157 RepID=UPI002ED29991